MEADFSPNDIELFQLLSDKIACAPTPILEVPFAYQYSPEQYGGKWIKIEPDEVIILNESRKLLGLKAYKVHYQNQKRTGWVLLKYCYSHMVPTKSLLNCNSNDLENFVLIKVLFKADFTDPELERLSITREEAEDVLDFNREHPRNLAKRRRFD
nr:hypothetical protein Iba_chr01aCG5320 [Ipomoea batatas]